MSYGDILLQGNGIQTLEQVAEYLDTLFPQRPVLPNTPIEQIMYEAGQRYVVGRLQAAIQEAKEASHSVLTHPGD